jgi:hypothetical protein
MAYQVSPGINVTEIDLTTVVPGIATATGALAGIFSWGPVGARVLISNENQLVATFGKPNANNAETFFTAANFLSYGNALQVVRAANTTSAAAANGALNAVANTDTVTVLNNVVKNRNDYLSVRDGNTSSNAVYIAKYPGALGNSLKISVCDSTNAYSSALNMVGTQTGNNINGSFTINIGSNTGTFVFYSDGAVSAANTYTAGIANNITVGDLIAAGNNSTGLQYLRVVNVGSVSVVNSEYGTFTVGFDSPYRLAANFVVSNTENGNTTVANVTRNWEYFNVVDSAPTTSFYVANFGNSAAIDTMHVVVVDADGQFGGAPGTVLEVYRDVSRATDAKTQEGASNYYKTVINDGSAYVWWANDRADANSAPAASVASSTNTKPLTLDFAGGTDGFTEATAPLGIVASGYDLFTSTEEVDISLVMQGKPISGSTVVNGQTVSNFQLANYLIQNIAEVRKDCVVFVSPDDAIVRSNPGAEASSIVNWFGAVADSTYAVYDSGYKYAYDRYSDVYRYVPLNGDIAGLAARTETTNDAWWSPATSACAHSSPA